MSPGKVMRRTKHVHMIMKAVSPELSMACSAIAF